LKLIEEFNK